MYCVDSTDCSVVGVSSTKEAPLDSATTRRCGQFNVINRWLCSNRRLLLEAYFKAARHVGPLATAEHLAKLEAKDRRIELIKLIGLIKIQSSKMLSRVSRSHFISWSFELRCSDWCIFANTVYSIHLAIVK